MAAKGGLAAVLALLLLMGSGCVFGVYSMQDYGPRQNVMGVSKDQTFAGVLETIGAPDEVFESGDTTVLVYTQIEGEHILGIYSSVKKGDYVIVLEKGKVVREPVLVSKGEAQTILGLFSAPVVGPAITEEK